MLFHHIQCELQPVKGLHIETCNDNNYRKLYQYLSSNITVNIKGYNITIIPPPSQTSSDCQYITSYCNISSDVTSFDINYLEYNVNYTIAIYLFNYYDEKGEK